jgi:hypothetical protein
MNRLTFTLLSALVFAPMAALLAAETPQDLSIFDGNYPRAFFFRSCEGGPSRRGMTYEKWESDYDRLMGIMGKALDEEVIGREASNPEWFTRFKHDNPRQVVLLHFNGNARDPRHGTGNYFPGHWIYRQAVAITADVPAEAGETVIQVSDTSDFQVLGGRYKTSNDDIALFAITPEGTHDWARCEQVQLVSVGHETKTIRVRRACYGSKPLAFKAGQARAAAHMVEGPWGKGNHIMWYYNFATHCPKDPQGKTCADHLVDDLAAWFGKGGKLEAFDGLEFDVMFHETRGDTDGDGLIDNGVIGGVNQYGIGMHDFARNLRSRLGDRRIIQGDGALGTGGIRSQRAMVSLNGIESEGFPNLHDWDFDDWSGGLNRHNFWQANARPPVFNYINHKWNQSIPGKPGEHENPDVPFSRHRLAFAAAQFTDAVLTYAFTPPSDAGNRIAIWDELVGGKSNTPGWLGKPLGPAVRPAAKTPDLLAGIGMPPGDALAKRIGNAAVANGAVTITPAADGTFSIRNITANGNDLLVLLTVSAEPRKSYPSDMPRLLHLEVVSGGLQSLMSPDPGHSGMCLRGKTEGPIEDATGTRISFKSGEKICDKTLPAYAIQPPYQGGKGYVFFCRDAEVPGDSELRFHLGMGPKSPEKSDGVWFRVLVSDLADGKPGVFTQIFERSTKAHQWLEQSVPLARYAGKRVRFKFVADCGPADNAVTDHGRWGDIKIIRTGAGQAQTAPKSYMTWVNNRDFPAAFYFRDIRSTSVDLNFKVEGNEPVTIHHLTAHAHPDAIHRHFENGLVLANPSAKPYTFDLQTIAPDRKFSRIQGSPTQDPATNNGHPVGRSVTLAPLDALFLRVDPQRSGDQ